MKSNSGNILFLILIAVALFAALSYAITGSSRTSSSSISKDKAGLIASEIIQYAAQVEAAMSRMMLINQVPLEYIDVSKAGYVIQTANTNCSTDNCKLFAPEGGGLVAKLLPKEATDPNATSWAKTDGQSRMYFIISSVQDVGSDLPELMLLYGGVDEEVCNQINLKMKVTDGTGKLLTDNHGDYSQQAGSLIPYPSPTGILGDTEPKIVGQRTFCSFHGNPLVGNYFYYVLVAR